MSHAKIGTAQATVLVTPHLQSPPFQIRQHNRGHEKLTYYFAVNDRVIINDYDYTHTHLTRTRLGAYLRNVVTASS